MFGISLSKLIVLALVAWAVWYLFRLVRGFGNSPKVTRPKPKARFEKSQETVQCPKCKVYVVAGSRISVGKKTDVIRVSGVELALRHSYCASHKR